MPEHFVGLIQAAGPKQLAECIGVAHVASGAEDEVVSVAADTEERVVAIDRTQLVERNVDRAAYECTGATRERYLLDQVGTHRLQHPGLSFRETERFSE